MCDAFGRKNVFPRLFDYFVVVGNNKANGHSKVNAPQLLLIYQITNHKDFELPTNIVYFCQPDGCIQNLPRRPGSFSQQSTSNAFVFALTDKDTNRTRYGVCVNFYRQIERHHSGGQSTTAANSTAATVNLSNGENQQQNPFLNLDQQNNPFLNPSVDQTSAECSNNEFDANQLHPAESPRPESSVSQLASTSRPQSLHRHRPIYVNSLTSLCLISHHPFFSSFRECIFTIKRLIERCNTKHAQNSQFDRNNNEYEQNQGTIKKDAIWSLLTGDCSIQNCNNDRLKEDLKQIEIFIMRLLSSPVPIAGRTKLELELLDLPEIPRLTLAYSEHTRFSLIDFPLHLPLELLGVNSCIQVLSCILLEHKVILQSSNYNALCMSVMAFVAMLYPLEYMFPVIPLLPASLESAEQLLLAPTPYIIGIPVSFLKLREKNFRLPNDVWLVDLDANRIVKPEAADEIPPLPEPEHTILSNQLKAALQIMSSNTNASGNRQDNDVDCVDVATRVAMVNFFNSPNMLANFTEHTRTIKLYPRPVVAVQHSSFLQSRPQTRLPFLAKFIRTQAVEYYAEFVLCPKNMAFLRVQTGVCDPRIVGDKVKWFSQTLQPVNFKVWNKGCNRQFLAELLNKQNGRSFSPSQMILNEEEYSSDDELSSSSSCSSLTNFANDFLQSEISSSTISHQNKAMPVQEQFSDQMFYDPPTMLKLPSESGELIDHTEELEPENVKNSKDIYLKSDKDGHSSQYSSTSSLSSESDAEPNDAELKLFDETDNYAKVTENKLEKDKIENEKFKKTELCKEENSNKLELNQITATASSSTSTASSTTTIVANSTVNQQDLNENSQQLTATNLTDKTSSRPQQRPNSTSGSSNVVRSTTPHKFHSLDSNIERQQYQKGQSVQSQSVDCSTNNANSNSSTTNNQTNKPQQKHSSSLDRTSSTSATTTRTGGTVIDRTNSTCSSPTLSRTISISSVFSRNGSLANSMQNLQNNIANNLKGEKDATKNVQPNQQAQQSTTSTNQTSHHPQPKHQNSASSFLDRFTKEAKSYTRDALQATKKEMDGRKNTLMQKLEAFNETANTQLNKPPQQQSTSTGISSSNQQQQQSNTMQSTSTATSSSSQTPDQTRSNSTIGSTLGDKLASNLSANLDKFEFSNEINGLADKTSSVLSGFFSGKMVDRVKEKVQQQQQQFQQFPGRKGLVERTNLIKHSNQPTLNTSSTNYSSQSQSSQAGKKPTSKLQHSENQNFLQGIIDNVLAGEGIGWLKFNRVKNLMEDENYRNFVVSRLNKTLNHKLGPDDHVQDVEINKNVWKGMLKLLVALIHGLEHTYMNNGLGGMQSTLVILEIAHTHYWVKELNDEQQSTTNGSSIAGGSSGGKLTANTNSLASTAATSPFGSNENLSSSNTLHPTASESNEQLQLSPQKISNAAFETIMEQKKQQNPTTTNLNRIESVESEVSDLSTTTSSSVNTTATTTNCNASETGSLTVNPAYLNRLGQTTNYRNTFSDSELDGMVNNANRTNRATSVWSSKSSISNGMHYPTGNLMNTALTDCKRTYLFQGLIGKEKSSIWEDPQFWEDVFLDAVSQERELIGLDQGASEMIERYQTLNEAERKRLEHEEDRLLTNLLHNMVAFMVMLKVNQQLIRTKIRRLLGRCHIGVIYSDEINSLLQRLDQLQNNDIDLKPSASRQTHRQTFTLYIVTDKDEKDLNNNLKVKDSTEQSFKTANLEQMCFMEVRDDGLILRSISGTILERWFYERLVQVTYCPKNKTLCLWRKTGEGQTHLHKYRSKRSKDLYYAIKQAMDKAATKGIGNGPGAELGGEFPVQDVVTGEGGLIQVCMEGVGLLFACSKFFVRLENIRKCYTQKGGIFVIEEYNPKTRQIIERKYKSTMSDQICYSILCVFSYFASGPKDSAKKPQVSPQRMQQTAK